MDFGGERSSATQHRAIRAVVAVLGLVVAWVGMLVLPIVFSMWMPLQWPILPGLVGMFAAMAGGWSTWRVGLWLGVGDPLIPSDWNAQSVAASLASFVMMFGIWGAALAVFGDLPVWCIVLGVLPSIVRSNWGHPRVMLRTAVPLLAIAFLVWAFVPPVAPGPPPPTNPPASPQPSSFPFALALQILLPTFGVTLFGLLFVGAVAFVFLRLYIRRLLVPMLHGQWDVALGRAGPDMKPALLLEMGDLDAAEQAQEHAPDGMMKTLTGASLRAERGDEEGAWTEIREAWTRDQSLPDVMIAAAGLRLGHDVLELLDELEAHRSLVLETLMGFDQDEVYQTCRAWALAAVGRHEHARRALPEPGDHLPPLIANERDYLRAEALRALDDPGWRACAERGASGIGRCARLAQRML